MKQEIVDFLEGKRFAVVGVSRAEKKFGNAIFTELKARGFQMYAVHPEMKEIGGEPCYPNLAALQGKIDGVIVCVQPDKAGAVLRDAANAGVKNVWLQSGAQSAETQALAASLGLKVVAGKCILMYAQPVGSFHGFHRGIMRLFGQL